MVVTAAPPRVTVLMPLSSTAAMAKAAGTSVLRQSAADLELLVIVDDSQESTVRLLPLLPDARVRVILAPQRGAAGAHNLGLAEAKGEFIMWQDPHSTSAPDRIAAQLRAAADGASLVHHDVTTADHACDSPRLRRGEHVRRGYAVQAALRQGDRFIPGSAMIRRSSLGAHRLDEDAGEAAFNAFIRRVASHVQSVHVPEVLMESAEVKEAPVRGVTVEDSWAATTGLLSGHTLEELVPTAFQPDWLSDSTTVAMAFAVLCWERRGLSLEAVHQLDQLSPCSTRAGALMVTALLELAQGEPATALRALALVPENAFSSALKGDAHRELRDIPAAEAAYTRSLAIDPASYDAVEGLRLLGRLEAFQEETLTS